MTIIDIGPIAEFQGKYRWLSNFWPAVVYLDNIKCSTVEHGYQAGAKTFDLYWRTYIISAPTPGSAKKRAREIPFEYQRRASSIVKIEIMRDLLWQKFEHSYLRQRLLDTDDRMLIEGNAWGDTFWGICGGKGQNRLGKLLMEIRAEIVASGR